MRNITDHKVNGLNEALEVTATDSIGSGGANHVYEINLPPHEDIPGCRYILHFQNGPVQHRSDMNGITNEALLAVVIDRMRGFQSGKFACRDNAVALTKMEEAMMWLQKRTRDRMARGVEGTLEK